MQVNKTTLYFPKPLSAIYGNAMQWSYAGGLLKCVQTGCCGEEHSRVSCLGCVVGTGQPGTATRCRLCSGSARC